MLINFRLFSAKKFGIFEVGILNCWSHNPKTLRNHQLLVEERIVLYSTYQRDQCFGCSEQILLFVIKQAFHVALDGTPIFYQMRDTLTRRFWHLVK